MTGEAERIKARYERRTASRTGDLYNPLQPSVLYSMQERERALCRWIRAARLQPVQDLRVLEIGCGTGSNLLQLLRLGFQPENLAGNDLLPDRLERAAELLPSTVELLAGDAMDIDLESASFDIVLQSTVFTSILDESFQFALAERMWKWVAPGGGVLWYDFSYDNPQNPDVKGVHFRRVRELFPEARQILRWRITLAPPISRLVTRMHPSCYTILNALPFLRTHILAWIPKGGR